MVGGGGGVEVGKGLEYARPRPPLNKNHQQLVSPFHVQRILAVKNMASFVPFIYHGAVIDHSTALYICRERLAGLFEKYT